LALAGVDLRRSQVQKEEEEMTKLAPEELAVLGIGGAFIFATLFPGATNEYVPRLVGWLVGLVMLAVALIVIALNR